MQHVSLKAKEWYQQTKEEVERELSLDVRVGLSRKEAGERLKRFGKNQLTEASKKTVIDRIVDQIRSPLVFILLSAGIVTTILGSYVDTTVIFLAVIINIAISLYQEGRANRAFERLRAAQEKFALVLRDGEKQRISSEELVPGDLVLIETGMSVPADARIILSNNLQVNESVLTGEWNEVEKHDEIYQSVLPPFEQKNMLFMGTLITGGGGQAVVVATGNRTELGRIAVALGEGAEQKTPLQQNVANVARFLSYIILTALVGIFTLGLLRGEPITELILVSIAIAVAAIPEGLPAAVTVVLAIGMEAILKRGGLVRNLLAAETLGSTTIILTDKTGTLTQAEMRVARVVTLGTLELEAEAHRNGHKEHEAHGDERDALQFAALGSDAYIERCTADDGKKCVDPVVRGRPVERAVVLAALESGLDQDELLKNYPRIDFLPFESRFRMALSLNRVHGLKNNRIYVMGAPEHLLPHARHIYLEGKAHVHSKELEARFLHALKKYTSEGMRVIGVGYHETDMAAFTKEDHTKREALIEDLVFVGMIVLHDPLREDVAGSIRIAQGAGARVIMATGDNAETAKNIAKECGIWKEGDHISLGTDVAASDDEKLAKILKHSSVFARMLPEHKMRIVRFLTASGEVVAMTGDGVNDAPALRAASIGVALGSGTEVAKEASDLILQNNSFTVIVAAIEEGRRIIDNLRKIIAYLLSTSFSEIIVVGGALVAGFPIPLLPAQILWTNMLSEGFMNFAFAFEPKEDDLMSRDPKVSGARMMLSKTLTIFIVAVGVISGLLLLGLYWLLLTVKELSHEEARTIVFIALTLGTTLAAFSFKDLRSSILHIRIWSNRYLLGSLTFALFGLFIALAVEPVREMLRLVPLDFGETAPLLFAVIVINLGAIELAKFVLFERRNKKH